MSGARQPSTKPGVTGKPSRPPGWRRGVLLGAYTLMGVVGASLAGAILDALWPTLFAHVPDVVALALRQPLWAQVGGGVILLAALVGLVRLMRAGRQEQQAAEEEAAEAAREARIADQQAGNKLLQEPLAELVQLERQQVELTRQQVEGVSKRLEVAAPTVPAGVVALMGLPRPASLIGREQELKQLMEGLRAGESMGIFALAGMGGVGKTAIAAEAVAQLSEEREVFPGGAAWIACDELRGEEGLAELWTRMARALRLEQVVTLADPEARRVALAAALAQRPRLLLALDNIEPGQEAKPGLDAEAVLETLAVRGHTAVLLTSRQVVAPQRLAAITVAPLEVPDARKLLLQRLQQIDPTRPTAQEASAIPKLLEVIGGLPLAIELTAAYAGVQRRSLDAVLSEIEIEGVQAGALRGNARRGVLQCFERSWRALTARQQRLLAGLSLLSGASFPRAAALAVAQASVAKAETDAEGDLATLVSFALVEPLADDRLRLHPLLREYAEDKLAKLPKEQQERLGDAMVAYWLAYAEAHPGYEGMDALEAETAGLMGALAWAHVHTRHREVLRLAQALSEFWFIRGLVSEAHRARAWALHAATELHTKDGERWARHELAVLDAQTGQPTEARAGFKQALQLAQQIGDLAAQWIEVTDLAVRN